MADHGTTVRGIDYKATFPFVHLFKAFRLAIDPSKIVLALGLLLLVYAGGRLMDAAWPERHRAVRDEIGMYVANPVDFEHNRDAYLDSRASAIRSQQVALGFPNDPPDQAHLEAALRAKRDTGLQIAGSLPASPARDNAVHDVYAAYDAQLAAARAYQTEGLFIHFLMFEVHQVDAIVWSAVHLRIVADAAGPGIVDGLTTFAFTAPSWAITQHPLFFTLFFAWLLVLWSIFGGALARIAAVQVARDEKISLRQALRFSTGKVLSFIFAPLIPVIIVAVVGLVIAVASLLISVPGISGIWAILLGIVFFVVLLAGLVMMLTALGLVAGGHLMYPTIATEGSDSFDAVSRSFSYLYARPWQLGFYAFVSLVYGAITYLVMRLVLFVLLLLVHGSVDLFQWGHAADGSPVFEAMWPRPTDFMNLSYDPHYAVLNAVQAAGASVIAFWVYIALSVLGAYVISLYVSSSTLVYFLLRRVVDATEMDEVYLEETDDELLTDAAVASEAMLGTSIEPTAASVEPVGQPIDVVVPPAGEPPMGV